MLYNYYLDHSDSSLYEHKEISNLLQEVNRNYPAIIKEYACEKECTLLTQYFYLMDELNKENLTVVKQFNENYNKQKEVYSIIFSDINTIKQK